MRIKVKPSPTEIERERERRGSGLVMDLYGKKRGMERIKDRNT